MQENPQRWNAANPINAANPANPWTAASMTILKTANANYVGPEETASRLVSLSQISEQKR